MIVLEEHGLVVSATQALNNDQCCAMVDSGTNAIIVPLHPGMQAEIAECQVQSATVTGPIVQVYSHNGAKRLVVALPNSAILASQEWLPTVAGWTFFSGPKPGLKNSACENKVYPAGGKQAFVLSMKTGLCPSAKALVTEQVDGASFQIQLGRTQGRFKTRKFRSLCLRGRRALLPTDVSTIASDFARPNPLQRIKVISNNRRSEF